MAILIERKQIWGYILFSCPTVIKVGGLKSTDRYWKNLHTVETGHSFINWINNTILHKEDNFWKRKIKEALAKHKELH